MRIGLTMLGVCLLLWSPSVFALECEETAQCEEGYVCQKGGCIEVTSECAGFCESFSPCFKSGGGEVCTGVVAIYDVSEPQEAVEECHPYEGPVNDPMEDCLADCSDGAGDADAWGFWSQFIACMEDADYDCAAKEACAENIGSGMGAGGDGDAVAIGGGATHHAVEDARALETDSPEPDPGKSGSSCTIAGNPEAGSGCAVLLLCCLILALGLCPRKCSASTGAPEGPKSGRPRVCSMIAVAVVSVVTAGLINLCGCAMLLPAPPPAMSAAKFVRGPSAGSGGKVGVSTGVAVVHSFDPDVSEKDDDTELHFPASEGAGSFQLGSRYDLAVTAGAWKATLEGNFLAIDRPGIRVGVLHGLGGGFLADLSEDDDGDRHWWLQYDLSAGMMFEMPAGDSGTLFAAFKYTYADDKQDNDESDGMEQTDYLTGSVGWLTSVGSLQLAPEIIVSRCTYEGEVDETDFGTDGGPDEPPETMEEGYWLFLVGLTIAAPF